MEDFKKFGIYKRDKKIDIKSIYSDIPKGVRQVVFLKKLFEAQHITIESFCGGLLDKANEFNQNTISIALVIKTNDICDVIVKFAAKEAIGITDISAKDTKEIILDLKNINSIFPMRYIVIKETDNGYIISDLCIS